MVAIPRQLRQGQHASRAEHVRALVARWRADADPHARNELLRVHLPLIESIARRYPARLGREDFLQEGQLGFLRALETYDPERGVELGTYARHWIRAYIHRYLLRAWSVVPRFTTHEKRRVFFGAGHARRALGMTTPKDGDELKIARKLRVNPNTVREVEHARALRDEPIEAYEEPGERFASSAPGPEEVAWEEERARLLRERLPAALGSLDARERMIFLERADPDEARTLDELGARLGVTRERARQLECRARRKLAVALGDLVDEAVADLAKRAPPPRHRRARSRPSVEVV